MSKRNTKAGPAYERAIMDKLKDTGLFPELASTSEVDPKLDADKVDITSTEPKKEFDYIIQAKSSTRRVSYDTLFNSLKAKRNKDSKDKIPVVFHNHTYRSGNRFIHIEGYAIVLEDDFISLMEDRERLKRLVNILEENWDYVHPSHQKELDKLLTDLKL